MTTLHWRYALYGFSATFIGVGLAQMAYAPIMPALIALGSLDASAAAQLGAGNLLGFLIGSSISVRLSETFGVKQMIRSAAAGTVIGLVACCFLQQFVWLFIWRTITGVFGGVLVVLTPPFVLNQVPRSKHGIVGGITFLGPGFGIITSATIVVWALQINVSLGWAILAIISAIFALYVWSLPASETVEPTRPSTSKLKFKPVMRRALPVVIVYCLNGLGLLPFLVFLVDFIARDLGRGAIEAGWNWSLFGVGSLIGPLILGHLADRIGFQKALFVSMALEILSTLTPVFSQDRWILFGCSLVMGGADPGIVALVLGRLTELVGQVDCQRVWNIAMIGFTLTQAVGIFGFSFLIKDHNTYYGMFLIGTISFVLALIGSFMMPGTSIEETG